MNLLNDIFGEGKLPRVKSGKSGEIVFGAVGIRLDREFQSVRQCSAHVWNF